MTHAELVATVQSQAEEIERLSKLVDRLYHASKLVHQDAEAKVIAEIEARAAVLEDEEAALDGTGLLNRARSRHDPLGVSAIIVSWQSEGEELQMVESSEPIVIGRDTGCDVVIMNPHVSRSHAVIWAHNSAWYVTDLQSANGTWLGGARIEERGLRDRDTLSLDRDGPQLTISVQDTDMTEVSGTEL